MTREQLQTADAVSLLAEPQPDRRISQEKAGELIARCLSNGNLWFDWLHCRANGETFPVEITMTVSHEQGKTFLRSVWRDLTGLTRTLPPGESHQEEEKP